MRKLNKNPQKRYLLSLSSPSKSFKLGPRFVRGRQIEKSNTKNVSLFFFSRESEKCPWNTFLAIVAIFFTGTFCVSRPQFFIFFYFFHAHFCFQALFFFFFSRVEILVSRADILFSRVEFYKIFSGMFSFSRALFGKEIFIFFHVHFFFHGHFFSFFSRVRFFFHW